MEAIDSKQIDNYMATAHDVITPETEAKLLWIRPKDKEGVMAHLKLGDDDKLNVTYDADHQSDTDESSDESSDEESSSDSEEESDMIVDVFAEATGGCAVQEKGCPCNSCFHNLSDDLNWKHIAWQLLLLYRGDYPNETCTKEDMYHHLRKELKLD